MGGLISKVEQEQRDAMNRQLTPEELQRIREDVNKILPPLCPTRSTTAESSLCLNRSNHKTNHKNGASLSVAGLPVAYSPKRFDLSSFLSQEEDAQSHRTESTKGSPDLSSAAGMTTRTRSNDYKSSFNLSTMTQACRRSSSKEQRNQSRTRQHSQCRPSVVYYDDDWEDNIGYGLPPVLVEEDQQVTSSNPIPSQDYDGQHRQAPFGGPPSTSSQTTFLRVVPGRSHSVPVPRNRRSNAIPRCHQTSRSCEHDDDEIDDSAEDVETLQRLYDRRTWDMYFRITEARERAAVARRDYHIDEYSIPPMGQQQKRYKVTPFPSEQNHALPLWSENPSSDQCSSATARTSSIISATGNSSMQDFIFGDLE